MPFVKPVASTVLDTGYNVLKKRFGLGGRGRYGGSMVVVRGGLTHPKYWDKYPPSNLAPGLLGQTARPSRGGTYRFGRARYKRRR